MLGPVRKFLRDRSGAFAIQFALMVVPLTVCTGLAIDGGRAFLARYELASALDAAALAVGSTYAQDADLDAIAQTFVEANFRSPHSGPIALTLTPGDDVLTLSGNVTIDTYFMPLVGQPTVTVSAESEVVRGGGNVEVSLILDTTGSMAGSRIVALREAAADLVDIVVNDDQTPFYSKVAIAPYSMGVNVGGYANAVRGTPQGPKTITAASWRNGSAKTVTASAWRTNSGKTITAATWKNGSAFTISAITKVTGPARIRVQTSSNHGYANGQFVRITGANGSYTGLNNNIYAVEVQNATRFYLRNIANTAYITPPGGSTNATAGSSQRCFSGTCEVRVTSSSHGFANNDRIYVNGVAGMTQINSPAASTWVAKSVATNTFILTNSDGPSYSNYTSAGTASECYTASCEVQITASSHGFGNGDLVYITGVNGMTQVNNSVGSTWTIGGVATNTFILPGTNGPSFTAYTSGGSASECFNATCEVRITSAAHGLANNDEVQITGVGGMTEINNSGSDSWTVNGVATNTFMLPGSTGPSYSNYTAGGQSQCVEQGCQVYRFTNASGTPAIKIFPISTCASERIGANAYTDAAPSTAFVGRSYESTGNPCPTDNPIVPLTSDKDYLTDQIQDMEPSGSTAGHIGIAWGWYLLSPNFGYLFPAENQPAAYATNNLAKVAVLMTDGAFNTTYCNGVISKDSGSGSGSTSDHINCDATNGSSSSQAVTLCQNMKDAGIIVYAVGFEIDGIPGATEIMEGCATSANHFYTADNGAELKAAFKSIAKSISKLRISK